MLEIYNSNLFFTNLNIHLTRLQELRSELNETKSSRNQLEQVTYALSEELRTVKNRVESQQTEFGNMINEVRNRARKLEEENRIHVCIQASIILIKKRLFSIKGERTVMNLIKKSHVCYHLTEHLELHIQLSDSLFSCSALK